MDQYICLKLEVSDEVKKEVINYYLEENGVSSIEEIDSGALAYFEINQWAFVKAVVKKMLGEQDVRFSEEEVENRNWNAIWESSFEPVNINNFCYVRAPFHLPFSDDSLIDIILEPRMAFGTAHHATTYMMMQEMQHIKMKGMRVFDYGCGTAILSILAEKMGAKSIYAIDIEENAVENANYNAEINRCRRIRCEQKQLEEISEEAYDIILANINRQVLLDSAQKLIPILSEGGTLLISGILDKDVELVVNTYAECGWKKVKMTSREDWRCIQFFR